MSKETKVIETVDQELAPLKNDELNLSLQHSPLDNSQLLHMLQKTPQAHIYKRPAKGGGEWDYVTGVYVKKVLNYVFGWLWDFEVVETDVDLTVSKQVNVLGRLTVKVYDERINDYVTITKQQYGRADIKFKKAQPEEPMDLGNDKKSAVTDALKKCASEFGVASDIYGKNEFKDTAQKIKDKKSNQVEDLIKKINDGLFDDEQLQLQLDQVSDLDVTVEERKALEDAIKAKLKKDNE